MPRWRAPFSVRTKLYQSSSSATGCKRAGLILFAVACLLVPTLLCAFPGLTMSATAEDCCRHMKGMCGQASMTDCCSSDGPSLPTLTHGLVKKSAHLFLPALEHGVAIKPESVPVVRAIR